MNTEETNESFVKAHATDACLDNFRTASVTIQLIRNATLKITYEDTLFLIDPMFAEQGAYPGFANTHNSHLKNPTVPLPMPVEDILSDVDAIIVTHTHLDHWDIAAQKQIPKDMKIFVQNEDDASQIRSQGFTNVEVLQNGLVFENVHLFRTEGQHGTSEMYAHPELARILGKSIGVIFTAPGKKTVYLAGDTIWTDTVKDALALSKPDIIILNAGGCCAGYAFNNQG